MDDLQNVGVEHLAGDFQAVGQAVAGAAVGRVADDGMAEVGEVDADLVGAAGFDADAQEAGEGAGGENLVVRDGGAAFFRDGHLLAVDGMAANGKCDGAGRFFWEAEAIDRASLRERLATAAQQQPQPELHLRADKATAYQAIAEVLADSAKAGVVRIGFISDPAEAKP